MNRIARNLLILLAFAFAAPATALALGPADVRKLATETLTIETKKGKIAIEAEIAIDPADQELGLMFRTSLAENNGMLFVWDEERPVSMWMKNTLIPLDMLFIDHTGKILYIAENTTPKSLASITAGKPVLAILELAGGTAKKKHIRVGDHVKAGYFKP